MIEIIHPADNKLVFMTEFHKAEPASGEFMYSLGSPPLAAGYKIKKVFYDGADITSFIKFWCDEKIYIWENEINN